MNALQGKIVKDKEKIFYIPSKKDSKVPIDDFVEEIKAMGYYPIGYEIMSGKFELKRLH